MGPAVILIIISLPSFYMLYLSEESINTFLTVKAVGHQWYWTYDYVDLFPCWYNYKTDASDIDEYIIESNMLPAEFLEFEKGDLRLLDKTDIFIYRMGVFYGQCSEICGIGHGFMPICLYAISFLNFFIGDI